MRDFFVSYNGADKAWAEWIAWTLEEAGYSVVVQAWDFRPGGNFVLEMQKAAGGTKATIAVLSDNYLSAEYTQPEWAAAFARDPQGGKQVLIPVRIAKCSPSGLLKTLIFVDLVDLPEDEARSELLDALNERAKPSSAPKFPGQASGTAPLIDRAPAYPGLDSVTPSRDPEALNMGASSKVFISYSHDSREHVIRVADLATSLRRDGVDCRIDLWLEGSPPEGWRFWMEKTIAWADFVLVVCSEAYLRRVRKEEPPGKGLGATWEAHLIYQHLYEHGVYDAKFIPVIFDDADIPFIPLPLRGVNHFLLKDLRGYQTLHAALADQWAPAQLQVPPPCQQSQSIIFRVPFRRNPFFTGRGEILARLGRRFARQKDRQGTDRIQVLCGLGGVGKSQIALEYAYRSKGNYSRVFWVRAETEATLFSDFDVFSDLLGEGGQESGTLTADSKNRRNIISAREWLCSNDEWLLVLDNVEDLALVEPAIPNVSRGDILITSRASGIFQKLGVARPIQVKDLAPQDACLFLVRRSGEGEEKPKTPVVQELAKALGYLPLALEQAGAYLCERHCTFEQYLDAFRRQGLRVLEKRSPVVSPYPATVATTWLMNFGAVSKASEPCADFLRASAFLNSDYIPLELFKEAGQCLGPGLSATVIESADPLAVEELCLPLIRLSLVRRADVLNAVSIHRLVQQVLRDQMGDKERRTWLRRVVAAKAEVYTSRPLWQWRRHELDEEGRPVVDLWENDPFLGKPVFPASTFQQFACSHEPLFRPRELLELPANKRGVVASHVVLQKGKRIAFFLDTGIDATPSTGKLGLRDSDRVPADVFERAKRQMIAIRNPDPVRLSVLAFHYANANGDYFCSGVNCLPPESILVFDPFDFQFPLSSFSTRNFFAEPATRLIRPLSAQMFGSGRFFVFVSVVEQIDTWPQVLREYVRANLDLTDEDLQQQGGGLKSGRIVPITGSVLDLRGFCLTKIGVFGPE